MTDKFYLDKDGLIILVTGIIELIKNKKSDTDSNLNEVKQNVANLLELLSLLTEKEDNLEVELDNVVHKTGNEIIRGKKDFYNEISCEGIDVGQGNLYSSLALDFGFILNNSGESLQNIIDDLYSFLGTTPVIWNISYDKEDYNYFFYFGNYTYSSFINSSKKGVPIILLATERTTKDIIIFSNYYNENEQGFYAIGGNNGKISSQFIKVTKLGTNYINAEYYEDSIGGSYSPPSTGIPETDLSTDVQYKLNDLYVKKSGDTMTGTLKVDKYNYSTNIYNDGIIIKLDNTNLLNIGQEDGMSGIIDIYNPQSITFLNGYSIKITEKNSNNYSELTPTELNVSNQNSSSNITSEKLEINSSITNYKTTLSTLGLKIESEGNPGVEITPNKFGVGYCSLVSGDSESYLQIGPNGELFFGTNEARIPKLIIRGKTGNDILLGNGNTTSLATLLNKLDSISDLSEIRNNALKGKTIYDNSYKYYTGVRYNSEHKTIEFLNGTSTMGSLDVTLFTGSSDTSLIELVNSRIDTPTSGDYAGQECLILVFNTTSGVKDIEIPLSSIFDSSKYYTKTLVDNLIGGLVTDNNTDIYGENIWASHTTAPTGNSINAAFATKFEEKLTPYNTTNIEGKLGPIQIWDNLGSPGSYVHTIGLKNELGQDIERFATSEDPNRAFNGVDSEVTIPTVAAVVKYVLDNYQLTLSENSAANKNFYDSSKNTNAFNLSDDSVVPTAGAIKRYIDEVVVPNYGNKVERIVFNGTSYLPNNNKTIEINYSGGGSGSGIASGVKLWGNDFDGSDSIIGDITFGSYYPKISTTGGVLIENTVKGLNLNNNTIIKGNLHVEGNIISEGNVTAYSSESSTTRDKIYFDLDHYFFLDNGVLKYSADGVTKTVKLE